MENALDHMLNDPMFWKIALVIIVLILVASFKKLFKLAIVLGVIIFIYAVYLVFTGQEPDDVIKNFEDAAVEIMQETNAKFEKPNDQIDDSGDRLDESPKIPAQKVLKPEKKKKRKQSDADIMNRFEEEEKRIMDKFKKP